MLYKALADLESSSKIDPTPLGRGYCPICKEQVIAKCGRIRAKHWAHQNTEDCDKWSEGETDWHLSWKNLVRDEYCEFVKGSHRADIVGNEGVIIELQHSPLSVNEIEEREQFYKRMIWILDIPEDKYVLNIDHNRWFRMKGGRASLTYAKCKIFIDCGDFMFYPYYVQSFWSNRLEGIGVAIKKKMFILEYLNEVLRPNIWISNLKFERRKSCIMTKTIERARMARSRPTRYSPYHIGSRWDSGDRIDAAMKEWEQREKWKLDE